MHADFLPNVASQANYFSDAGITYIYIYVLYVYIYLYVTNFSPVPLFVDTGTDEYSAKKRTNRTFAKL